MSWVRVWHVHLSGLITIPHTKLVYYFIRTIDKFFDCFNSKGPKMAMLKSKADTAPYTKVSNYRFEV